MTTNPQSPHEAAALDRVTQLTPEVQLGAASLEAYRITDASTLSVASEFLKAARGRLGQIETERKAITDPLNQVIKRVQDLFRPAESRLGEAIKSLTGEITRYHTAVEAHNAQLRAAAAAAAAQATPQGHQIAVQATLAMVPKPDLASSGMTMRRSWKLAIVNPENVPRQFCTPDERMIKAYMQGEIAAGRTPHMPGVTFTEEFTPVRLPGR